MKQLISLTAVDTLLVDLDKRKCPWCDGNSWALRASSRSREELESENKVTIRALSELSLYLESGALKGTASYGVGNLLPVVAIQCNECGYIYLFDYFKLVEIYNERHENDGTPPAID